MEENFNNQGGKGSRLQNPRLIVVRSNGNSGKTTTIWMVFYELLHRGAIVRNFLMYNPQSTAYPPTMPGLIVSDFEAELEWNGKQIIIFSEGDIKDDVDALMTTALAKHPDYIICASRSQYRTNSTWELFETTYTNLRFERVCFWSEHSTNIADAICVKQPIVEAILKYIA